MYTISDEFPISIPFNPTIVTDFNHQPLVMVVSLTLSMIVQILEITYKNCPQVQNQIISDEYFFIIRH
jgi:hypothetical protein